MAHNIDRKVKKRAHPKEQGFESDVSSSSDQSSSNDDLILERKPVFRPGKLSKDAKETMQECTTEFLLLVTSEA